jgi:hypothetical protein
VKMPALGTPPANRITQVRLFPWSPEKTLALGTPGTKVEERQLDATTRGVFFADDFGTVYRILQIDNRQAPLTLEQQAEQFQTGNQLLEKQFVETSRGRELRMAGIHERASPIVARIKEQGRWVERKNNLIEAWSVFRHGDYFYQVVAGVTSLHSPRDPGTMAEAKARLTVFLDGLDIHQRELRPL